MMSVVEEQDWKELIDILRDAGEKAFGADDENDASEGFTASRQNLQAFHTTAAMLGLGDLERVGVELERYVTERITSAETNEKREAVTAFGFAVETLISQMQKPGNGSNIPPVHVEEILEILDVSLPAAAAGVNASEEPPVELLSPSVPQQPLSEETAEEPCSEETPLDSSHLTKIVAELGGQMSIVSDEKSSATLVLRFQATPSVMKQVETLLSAGAPIARFAPQLGQQEDRFDKILGTIKEFMMVLSQGEYERAQEILLLLAEQKHQSGLYNEIGSMARELHNSLRTFTNVMDPSLKEMVEEKLPDSGNRLEHMLELTENAANTTIDHVEAMQQRNGREQDRLDRLGLNLDRLKAIGETAQKRLEESRGILDELRASALQNRDDLIEVLTAQDYQDLTGQIILKIIHLLKDLELKLVNVIRTFGVKLETGKKTQKTDDLYGPAHKAKEEALHSQDDVNALLAEFGF